MNFWTWFLKSLFSKRVIAYARFRPATQTIAHVLCVMFIAGIPFLFSMNQSAVSGVNHVKQTLESDLPSFHIENATLHLDSDERIFVDTVANNVIMIDPSNDYTLDELETYGEGVVFQKEQIIIMDASTTQTISYTLLGLQNLSKDQLLKRVHDLESFLPILLVIGSVFIYSLISGLAFLGITGLAVIGLLFKGKRMSLQYRHIWLIAAHAITFPVIALLWIDVLILKVPFLLLFLISALFVIIAILSIPIPKRKTSA